MVLELKAYFNLVLKCYLDMRLFGAIRAPLVKVQYEWPNSKGDYLVYRLGAVFLLLVGI
jgi:hypothetical protein